MAFFPLAFPAFGSATAPPPPVRVISAPPPPVAVQIPRLDEPQMVSLHTIDGIQLYQFRPEEQFTLSWSRDLRDTSRCELDVPPDPMFQPSIDIIPWLHWVSVWNMSGTDLLWTGPVQKVVASRRSLSISARDASALASRTRTPLTKAWDAADASLIAGELWDRMIELHNLKTQAIRRVDPDGDPFDYQVKAGEAMMEDTIRDLEGLGLRWTVVAGTPILGPAPKKPVISLGENDFLDDVSLTVDGSGTFNDVLLEGGDALSRARVELAGLNLQTIVRVDDMFGVSNVDRATYQSARHTAKIRYSLSLPSGGTLHPEAPVSLAQLIPSTRCVINAFDLRFLMELESVSVSRTSGDASVQVTMDSVNDELPELQKLTRALGVAQ